jgi:hypothetical protein
VALFVSVHLPAAWLTQPRDVVTPAHLAAFAVAAVACGVLVRPSIAELRNRIALLAVAGGATLATMFAVDPHWLVGPFGSLDPLVRQMWYLQVDEGLPMWQVGWSEAATGIAQPLVGLVGAAIALSRTSGEQRRLWAVYGFVLASITVAGVFVLRAETTASVVALPGTAYLCSLALRGAQKVSLMPVRVVASAAAVCIMTPAYAVPLTVTPVDQRFAHAFDAVTECMSEAEMSRLRMLPTGDIAAPLDITPSIVLDTPHRAIASGHHRNASGMRDVLQLFVLPPSQGASIVARRHSDYLVFCPGAPEAIRLANRGPNGLAAMLRSGKAPNWLEPLPLPGLRALKVWRVRKDLVATAANG